MSRNRRDYAFAARIGNAEALLRDGVRAVVRGAASPSRRGVYFKGRLCFLSNAAYVGFSGLAEYLGLKLKLYKLDEFSSTNYIDKLLAQYELLGYAIEEVVLGRYSEHETELGTELRRIADMTVLSMPAAFRDMIYDIQNWEWSREHLSQFLYDASGAVPVFGSIVKYGKNGAKVAFAIKRGNKITLVSKALQISKNNLDHIVNKHDPGTYARQLPHRKKELVLAELSGNKSFFNSAWGRDKIEEAVNFGYNEAASKGVTSKRYEFDFDGETITIYMKGGEVDTAWGNHKYTYDELLKLLE